MAAGLKGQIPVASKACCTEAAVVWSMACFNICGSRQLMLTAYTCNMSTFTLSGPNEPVI